MDFLHFCSRMGIVQSQEKSLIFQDRFVILSGWKNAQGRYHVVAGHSR